MVFDDHNSYLSDFEDKMVLNLNNSVVRSFRVGKLFPADEIRCMDFSSNGRHLICSKENHVIVYDCDKGIQECSITTRKYGADLIQFIGGSDTAIHTSTRVDHSIRHLNFRDTNNVGYTQYFSGHTAKVISLKASPVGDAFLSGSKDCTLRLWDIRTSSCRGVMRLHCAPIAAYDPEGMIFAVGIDSEKIKLYDMRSYQKGPFSTFKLTKERNSEWTDLKFSRNGKNILVNTDGAKIRLVDAFDGSLKETYIGRSTNKKHRTEASFSSDSQYVFSGSSDGKIYVWGTETGYKVAELDNDKLGPVQCVQYNPKYLMLVSASSQLTFWLPNLDEIEN